MIFHNKFFLFLVACVIAKPSFAIGTIHLPDFSNLVIPNPINSGCPEGYYVATCSDIEFSLDTVMAYISLMHKNYTLSDGCWPENSSKSELYKKMRLLFHMDDNYSPIYAGVELGDGVLSTSCNPNDLYNLKLVRDYIYAACTASIVCRKCPNGGTLDGKSTLVPADDSTPAYWKSFRTIADCYWNEGSDSRGDFEIDYPAVAAPIDNHCYYEY